MRTVLTGVLLVLTLSVTSANAAEPLKLELNTFQFNPAGELLGYDEGEGKIFFYTNGKATSEVKVPGDGDYVIVVEASCQDAKNEKARLKLTAGETVVKDKFELTTTDTKEYSFPVKLKKGSTKITIEFLNDEYKENEYDRNLYVHGVKLLKK